VALAEPLAAGNPLASSGVLMAQTWWHGFGMLALAIVGLALVNRWFILHLFTLLYLITGSDGASRFGLFLFLYPGVFLHELSHWVTAWLLVSAWLTVSAWLAVSPALMVTERPSVCVTAIPSDLEVPLVCAKLSVCA